MTAGLFFCPESQKIRDQDSLEQQEVVSGKYVYAGKKRCAKYQKFILIPDNARWYTAIRSESLIKASYKIVKRLFGLNYVLQKYHRSVSNVGLLLAYNLCMQIVKKLGREKMFAIVGYNASLPQQSAVTLNGIRIIMIVIPMIFAVISYLIYAKTYKLKGDYLDNMTKELKVIHEA